jgi:hypothetical protein
LVSPRWPVACGSTMNPSRRCTIEDSPGVSA